MLRGIRMATLANFWLAWAIELIFFFESARNMLPSSGKLLRNSNLVFKKRNVKKTLFTLPPPTLAYVGPSVHVQKIVLGRVSVRRAQREEVRSCRRKHAPEPRSRKVETQWAEQSTRVGVYVLVIATYNSYARRLRVNLHTKQFGVRTPTVKGMKTISNTEVFLEFSTVGPTTYHMKSQILL